MPKAFGESAGVGRHGIFPYGHNGSPVLCTGRFSTLPVQQASEQGVIGALAAVAWVITDRCLSWWPNYGWVAPGP